MHCSKQTIGTADIRMSDGANQIRLNLYLCMKKLD